MRFPQLASSAKLSLAAILLATPCALAQTPQASEKPAPNEPAKAEINVPKTREPYTEPLRFDPEDNGFSIDNPQLRWNMTSNDNVDIGGLKLGADAIGLAFIQAAANEEQAAAKNYTVSVSIRWPQILTRTGRLSLETLDGKSLWERPVNEESTKLWRRNIPDAPENIRRTHGKNPFGVLDIPTAEMQALRSGTSFRGCITQTNSPTERIKICTRTYRLQPQNGMLSLVDAAATADAGFYINEKKLNNSGVLNFPPGKEFSTKIVFSDSTSIEISSQPADPQLLDAVENAAGTEVILTGHGAKPLGANVRVIQTPISHFWAPTGIPQERIWQSAIPRENPTVRVLGAFNIPFTLLLAFDRLPKETERVYVRATSSSGTYSSSPVIHGYAPSGARVASKENSVRRRSQKEFEWRYSAPHQGEVNKAKLLVRSEDNKRDWVANRRMYRSFPFEVSGRLTGFLASDLTLIMMAEASAGVWFESLGFTQNSVLSKQRWGMSGRYFTTLTSLESSGGTKVDDFSVGNFDLKYNILPGVWHRDEIVGVIAGVETVKLAGVSGTFVGGGAYWARTMPKIFDDLFNFVPGLDFPKYVDMELILYPASLTKGVSPMASFNLNFHGRVFWSERFYGEMGFGIRRYAYTAPSPVNKGKLASLDLSAAYGTLGIGFVF